MEQHKENKQRVRERGRTDPVTREVKATEQHLEERGEGGRQAWVGSQAGVTVRDQLMEELEQTKGCDGLQLPLQLVQDQTFHASQVGRCAPALAQPHEFGCRGHHQLCVLGSNQEAAGCNA